MQDYVQITLGSIVTTLWYETEQKYKEHFSDDRVEAFLVNLLMYAMQHGYSIKCEAPVSEKLYYQLTEYLIPTISSNVKEYQNVLVDAPLITGRVIIRLLGQNCQAESIPSIP